MTTGGFFEQFIEDYFAECDEHLATMRRILLELDERAGTTPPDGALLQELLRSLHTVKGLSGMVGLTCAERVAHAMEDALRPQGAVDAPVDPRLVEAMFAASRQLERCIAARRMGQEPPAVDPFLAELGAAFPRSPLGQGGETDTAAAPTSADSGDDPETEAPHDEAPPPGGVVYDFRFTPSTALAERGVGVAAVRARLLSIGDLLEAKPSVTAAGGVIFDFRVAVRPGAAPSESWRSDGMVWTPRQQPDDAGPAERPIVERPVLDAGARRSSTPGSSDALSVMASGANVVRVDLTRLDTLMRLVGELVASRARLADALGQASTSGVGAVWDTLHDTSALMERQLRNLRGAVTRIRLVPVGEVFERLRFAVREVSREAGKQVVLELTGQDTEIDKLVVDRMLEPLLHLVRNAVSHGIEAPEERLARGKPAVGRLTLRATAAGDRIVIEVEDDGAGVDMERVASRAETLGLPTPLGWEAGDGILDVLCTPGFSTRDEADLASGRGVGMAVVHSAIQALGGQLALETTAGQGTRFTIELPLTLMIVDALLVEIGGQRMALPQPALREVLQVDAATITRLENNEVIAYRGGVLPLVSLRRLFGMPESSSSIVHLLVVGNDMQRVGLLVDRLLGLREIVVHPVLDPLVAVPGIAGATELGDGRVSLILDAATLVRLASERRPRAARPAAALAAAGASLTA